MISRKCSFLPVLLHVLSLVNRGAKGAEALPECATAPGLDRGQMSACRRMPAVTAAALRGMAAAAAECRHQFRTQRWNCSVLGGGAAAEAAALHTKKNLGRGLPQGGYREVAFARAILTAGIVLEVAKECSIGLLSECTCEPRGWRNNWNTKSSKAHWKWKGCSQALDFGVEFSKEFLDTTAGSEDAPSRVHQHNSNAGRLAVTSLLKLRCKCHGMSGSCALRTCWQAPPDLKQVGRALKSRFDSAVMVTSDNIDGDLVIRPVTEDVTSMPPHGDPLRSPIPSRTTGLLRRRRGSSTNTISLDEQLLYIERSPSFCDAAADVPGTSGRRCRRDEISPLNHSPENAIAIPETDQQDCSIMCCGRGFNLVKASPSKNCRCRFVWCCKVVCDVCFKEKQDWVAVCK